MTEADTVASYLRGERLAVAFIDSLRISLTTGDELASVMARLPEDEREGFCRAVQKALERR